jgi:hypothetical protein
MFEIARQRRRDLCARGRERVGGALRLVRAAVVALCCSPCLLASLGVRLVEEASGGERRPLLAVAAPMRLEREHEECVEHVGVALDDVARLHDVLLGEAEPSERVTDEIEILEQREVAGAGDEPSVRDRVGLERVEKRDEIGAGTIAQNEPERGVLGKAGAENALDPVDALALDDAAKARTNVGIGGLERRSSFVNGELLRALTAPQLVVGGVGIARVGERRRGGGVPLAPNDHERIGGRERTKSATDVGELDLEQIQRLFDEALACNKVERLSDSLCSGPACRRGP